MATVLSEDGILRNFTYDDFEAFFGDTGGTDPAVAPTLASVAPNTATAGTTNLAVTLTGTNFAPGATVAVDGANVVAGVTIVNATTITFTISTANLAVAKTLQITVKNTGSAASNAVPFTVT